MYLLWTILLSLSMLQSIWSIPFTMSSSEQDADAALAASGTILDNLSQRSVLYHYVLLHDSPQQLLDLMSTDKGFAMLALESKSPRVYDNLLQVIQEASEDPKKIHLFRLIFKYPKLVNWMATNDEEHQYVMDVHQLADFAQVAFGNDKELSPHFERTEALSNMNVDAGRSLVISLLNHQRDLVMHNDADLVQTLISGAFQWTAFHGMHDLNSLLLKIPDKTMISQKELGHAWVWASQNGHADILQQMTDAPGILNRIPELNFGDALVLASESGHLEVVQHHLSSPNIRKQLSAGAFEESANMAAYAGRLSILKTLLPLLTDEDLGHVLLYATQGKQLNIIHYIKDHEELLDRIPPAAIPRALLYSISIESDEFFKDLLYSPRPLEESDVGRALMTAAKNGAIHKLEMLLSLPQLEVRASDVVSSIRLAIIYKKPEIPQLILNSPQILSRLEPRHLALITNFILKEETADLRPLLTNGHVVAKLNPSSLNKLLHAAIKDPKLIRDFVGLKESLQRVKDINFKKLWGQSLLSGSREALNLLKSLRAR